MSRKLDVLVLLGCIQQSLCNKLGDKNIVCRFFKHVAC